MTAKIDEKYMEAILAGIPAGRMGTPEEVAGLVRFLALDPGEPAFMPPLAGLMACCSPGASMPAPPACGVS